MNLVQLLTLVALFFAGLLAGVPIAMLLPFVPESLVQVICAAGSVLIFAWPIYKRRGWLLQAPLCPRCGGSEYGLVSLESRGSQWRCKQCGQLILIELNAESIVVIGENGEVVRKLKLRWPKFVGRWKSV